MKYFHVLFLFLFTGVFAQEGFRVQKKPKAVIPFKLINNLIFVPLNINGAELTFLLDSGVNETILFSLDNKEVNFNDVEKVKFSGLGESKDIEGLRSVNNKVFIGKDYADLQHTVSIILDETINFSSHVGIPVHGIIGYQFFANHAVQIDYNRKKITVYEDRKNLDKKLKNFSHFPITIEGNKPYIVAGIEQKHDKTDSKMLIDLGNSDALWLFPTLIENFSYNRPNIDDYLGQGFNGSIYGKRSRIHRLYLGDFTFEKPLTAMPDEYSIQNLKLVPGRKGSVGSEVLRRFTVVFDYPNASIYLKKNQDYRDPFTFNKSGLDIQHDGMTWESDVIKVETKKQNFSSDGTNVYNASENFKYNFVLKPQYSISGCRKDSPCDVAGLLKGDRILRINRKKLSEMTLQEINEILKENDGTKLLFTIDRKGVEKKLTLTLTDPIPYVDED